jgi:hypothetical protein
MDTVYIVVCTTINNMEPSHYSSHEYESIQGIYSSNESALARVDELYEAYAKFLSSKPEYDYIKEECRIEKHKVNP